MVTKMLDVLVRIFPTHLEVWADAGLKDSFSKIDGVHVALNEDDSTRYTLFLDPRYRTDEIVEEVTKIAKFYTSK